MLIAQFDDIKKAYEYAKNHELQTGFKILTMMIFEILFFNKKGEPDADIQS